MLQGRQRAPYKQLNVLERRQIIKSHKSGVSFRKKLSKKLIVISPLYHDIEIDDESLQIIAR